MGVVFRKIDSIEPVVQYLTQTISKQLESGHSMLWLVPGGSGITVAVAVAKQLTSAPLEKLAVTLTDERYGQPGHPNSNWGQLMQAGFALPAATLIPVLAGGSLEETTASFAATLKHGFEVADYTLGFLGIGPDGHTSGILPNSPAVDSPKFAVGYNSEPYQRVTSTPVAIAKLDEAVVYATGDAKWPVLDKLDEFVPIMQQPAQVLKVVPKVTIFNDYKGDPA